MSTTEAILTLECSLLVVFLLLMIGAFILYRWRHTSLCNTTSTFNESTRKKKYVALPHTSAEPVQLASNVKQVNSQNLINEEGTHHPSLLDDMTDAGRLYFSLKYDSSILTIKLIKGENIPQVTKEETKAFVSVQIISQNNDNNTEEKTATSANYQRTYKFSLSEDNFLSYIIHFEVSRFDRFSKKYDIGYVMVSLSELQSHQVDISCEAFFTRDITPWLQSRKLDSRKRSRSTTTDQPEESKELHRVRKNSKNKQRRPQVLWHKLSHAVHAGFFQGLIRGQLESLQWDPFLIIQKYEYADSDESSEQEKSPSKEQEHHASEEDIPEFFSPVFHTESYVVGHSSQLSDSSPENGALNTSVNREFYRLVHSPRLSQSDCVEPVTSWSIPETFRFPPLSVRLQSSTVLLHSASTNNRQDRLHKLTSLSSSYRKKILRKSRRVVHRRSKITRMEPLRRLLYLDKDSQRSIKRLRGEKK